MSAFHYCPTCWPLDLGEHAVGRCRAGDSLVLAATPGQQIELLRDNGLGQPQRPGRPSSFR